MISEHDRVILTTDLPEYHLKAGDIGTVVHIYSNAAAYELEFFTVDGRTLEVATVESHQVIPLSGKAVLHARTLES